MELIFSSEFKNCLNLWSHKLNKLRFKMWKSGLIELHFWDVSELVLFKVCYDLVGLGKVGCILEVGGSLSLSYLFNSLQLLVFLQNLFFGFVDFLSSFSNDLIDHPQSCLLHCIYCFVNSRNVRSKSISSLWPSAMSFISRSWVPWTASSFWNF